MGRVFNKYSIFTRLVKCPCVATGYKDYSAINMYILTHKIVICIYIIDKHLVR
jgi:hypothetical protein